MSNLVFPPAQLAGRYAWNNKKASLFRTLIQESSGGSEARASLWTFPKYSWSWTFLRLQQTGDGADQLRGIASFYQLHHGRFESFLIADTEDNTLLNQPIAIGDGVTTRFQIVRTYGAYSIAPVDEVFSPSITVKVNGVLQTSGVAYNLNQGAIIEFLPGHIPGAGLLITVSGGFYFRARFDSDEFEIQQMILTDWRTAEIRMMSDKS